MVRAASLCSGASWLLPPPVSRDDAATEFGAEISENAWLEIEQAFERHGLRLDALNGTRDNKNPNDARGWHKRKGYAEKAIENAFTALNKINRDFLDEADGNVSLKRSGFREDYRSQQRLDKVLDELLFFSWLIREAEPISHEIMTESQSRAALARDVFAALKGAGAQLSNGWSISLAEPSNADLTGFERLAELMQIHEGETPSATAKWLREALAQDK